MLSIRKTLSTDSCIIFRKSSKVQVVYIPIDLYYLRLALERIPRNVLLELLVKNKSTFFGCYSNSPKNFHLVHWKVYSLFEIFCSSIYQNYMNLHFTNNLKLFFIFRTFNIFVVHPVCWLWQQKTCATRCITKSEFVLWKIMYSARLYNQHYIRYLDRYCKGDYMVSYVLRSKNNQLCNNWQSYGLSYLDIRSSELSSFSMFQRMSSFPFHSDKALYIMDSSGFLQ